MGAENVAVPASSYGKPPEQSPAPSRARSPAPASPARRAPATPLPAASRAGSPLYKVERSRPLRSRSPPYEVRLGNHSIAVPRNSARPRRDPSPRDNDRDRRQPSLRRSRSPDRSRREVRRDVSRGSRVAPSSYRGRERRSPRRRSYSPVSPRRRKSPRPPPRRRTPSPPSRSRTRSPTRTPPQKRHVLPPLKSPSRPPPPPPPTGPRIRPVHQASPRPNADGDVEMQELSEVVSTTSATGPLATPAEPSASSPIPAPASISPRPQSAAPSPVSPSAKAAPAISCLTSKPELDTDRRPSYLRRRSRSPPTGPRHHHYHVSTPSNRSPAQSVHAGPNLPSKPDWVRRNTGREAGKQEATASVPAPAASTAPSEPGVFVLVIPPHQPKPSITADIEADIARLHAHRMHVENEYIKIAKSTRKALNDLMIADIDLKNAESRRAVSSAQLEKARAGKLGIDFIAGS
ncbi:hypothetical protein V8D89_007227 [Ganoderma adspersum]